MKDDWALAKARELMERNLDTTLMRGRAIAAALRDVARRCAEIPESIQKVRDHVIWRGLEDTVDADGWRDTKPTERGCFRAASTAIREEFPTEEV